MTERKRNASEAFIDKDDIIALLLPPKSIKNDYVEQKPAEYVFKCMDGLIHVPEYGILRTEFYYQDQIMYFPKNSRFILIWLKMSELSYDYLVWKQAKARKVDENGNIFEYEQFPKSIVKYFTDSLFGFMPECTDIVETIQLMNFLLFDGQANAG